MTHLYDYNNENNTVDKWELRSTFGDLRAGKLLLSRSLFYHIFRDKDLKLFSEIPVPKNSKLYFAQPVPLAMNEIRRNYTIVKKPENADYIVFAPQKRPKGSFCTYRIEYYKDSKIAYIGKGDYDLGAVKFAQPAPKSECSANGTLVLYFVSDARNAYRNLLSGKFKAPCVTCDKLDLSTANKITLDALNIVLACVGTDRRYYSEEMITELQTKLTMLGQYDWRSVPYTIQVLRDLLRNTVVGYYLISNSSKNSKTVNAVLSEILNVSNSCDYDLILGRQLLSSALGVDLTTPAFVTLESLFEKLRDKGLSCAHLLPFFNCTVRLTDKTIN